MFTLMRESSLTAEAMWERLSTFRSLTDRVPLSTTIADAGEPEVGWHFVARTRLGPITFDDPMRIEEWDPPRSWKVTKRGLLNGWAHARVEPYAGGSRVIWSEEVWLGSGAVKWLTRRLGDRLGPMLFRRVVDGLLTEAAGGDTARGISR